MKKDEESDQKLTSKLAAHKRRWRLKLILVCVVIFCISLFIYIMNTPSQGTIIDTAKAYNKDTGQTTSKTLVSTYYTVEYPIGYELKTDAQKGAGQLDLQVLQKQSLRSNPGSVRISYGVEALPSGGATTMSPYNLAKAFPASYRIETKECGGNTCQILTKFDDGSAKILLWPHGKNVLVVAMSSQIAGTPPAYDSLMEQVLTTLKWKQ